MAIYKVSNMSPQLKEVNLDKDNKFTAQVNTSGESVQAYKMQILSGKGDEVIYDPMYPTELSKPVKNGNVLEINNINKSLHDEGKEFNNGKDYQWGVRVYNQRPGAEEQPNTVVCSGFEVGSTKNVIWSRINKDNKLENLLNEYNNMIPSNRPNIDSYFSQHSLDTKKLIKKAFDDVDSTPDKKITEEKINELVKQDRQIMLDQLVYDRYIEFSVDSQDQLMIGAKDTENQKYPDKYPYRQRKKIDWVDKDLGLDEDITKIETVEPFDYNYVNDTPYSIYLCSDEHTVNSFFADPNTAINVSDFVVVYYSLEDALNDRAAGGKPEAHVVAPVFTARKIIGYSSDTGEIRVDTPFEYAPTNKMAYRIFRYDTLDKRYDEVMSEDSGAYVPPETPYYKKYGMVPGGTDYYTDDGLTQNKKTTKDASKATFSFNESTPDVMSVTIENDSSTYYAEPFETNKVPNYTPYYQDIRLTKKAGVIGYLFNMLDNDTSTVFIDGIQYYIDTPIKGYLSDATPIYSDEQLTKISGGLSCKYYYRTNEYSVITLGGTTYYIKTPKTGKVAMGTPSYSDKELTTINGVFGATYTLVDATVARISVKSSNYFVKTEDLEAENLPRGTAYYTSPTLSVRAGTITNNTTTYEMVNQVYSKIEISGTIYYIKTPLTGEVPANTDFYLDSTFSTKSGTVFDYSTSTFDFYGYNYSIVTIDSQEYYIPSPLYGDVTDGTEFYTSYDFSGESIGEIIENSNDIYYQKIDAIHSKVVNASEDTPQDIGYIPTPKQAIVPPRALDETGYIYYKEKEKTTQAGEITNTDINYTFDSAILSFVDLNSNTYYIETPKSGVVGSTTPYYSDSSKINVAGLLVKDLPYNFYSPGKGKFTFNGTPYYFADPEVGETTDYLDVFYRQGQYGLISVGGKEYYVGNIVEMGYGSQIVGGTPINNEYFKVLTNVWDAQQQRLFIQPNINIKTDYTNPNEIVFENGVRIDIMKQTQLNETNGKLVDITINKLDDTQWLLENRRDYYPEGNYNNKAYLPLSLVGPDAPPIIPQSNYTIYTDFMDALPYALFYARSEPALQLQYRDFNFKDTSDFVDIEEGRTIRGVRSIQFNTYYNANDGQGIKYYKYTLYNATVRGTKGNIIDQSEDIYSSELVWVYRGFQSGTNYIIEIEITDQYGYKFTTSKSFRTEYAIEATSVLLNVEKDCNTNSVHVSANAPEYVSPYYRSDFEAALYEYFGLNELSDSNNLPCEDTDAKTYFKEFEYLSSITDKIEELRFTHPTPEQLQELLKGMVISISDLDPTQKVISRKEDYILVDGKKVLYYDSYNLKENKKIKIPVNHSFLTQFKLSLDFVDSIPFDTNATKAKIFSYAYEEQGFNGEMIIKPITMYLNSYKDYMVIKEDENDKLISNLNKGKIQVYSKFYTFGEGAQFYTASSFDVIAGLLGNFTYEREGQGKCSFKVGENTYYASYSGETVTYLPTGTLAYRDSAMTQLIGQIVTDINSYNTVYNKEYCSFNLDDNTYYIPTPEDCDEYGKLLSCFNVNGEYRNYLNILDVLGANESVYDSSKYTLALQHQKKDFGSGLEEYYRLYYKSLLPNPPLENPERYIYILDTPNGQSDYEEGLYRYDLEKRDYVMSQDNYVMIDNINMLVGIIPGWTENTPSLEEKFNTLNVPEECRERDQNSNAYTGNILWKDEDVITDDIIWVDGSYYMYSQIKSRVNKKWITVYLTVTTAEEHPVNCTVESLDYRWGDNA